MSAGTPPEGSANMTSSKNALKCRRCRRNLMEASLDMLNEVVDPCCDSTQQILSVATNEEEAGSSDFEYPSWINDQFDQAGWIRGKLLCPNCSAKVGAFNFVGGSRCQCKRSLVPSVYFVRAHIDVPVEAPPRALQPDAGSTSALQTATDISVDESVNENPDQQPGPSNNTLTHIGYVLIQGNEVVNMESFYDESSDRACTKMHRFERKLRTAIRRTRRGRVNRRVARIVKTVGYRIHENGSTSAGSCNEDEPDSGSDVEVDTDAQCPICLDVYCMPRRCAPCGHSFCGWCLRSLAHSTTPYFYEGYLCPLCRAKIVWTEDDKTCQQDVKTRYPSLVKRRTIVHRKQWRRYRWPLPEGTKWDQFLLAATMRLSPRRCALFAIIFFALFLSFKWTLIEDAGDSLLTQIRSNPDIISAITWIFAVSFCFFLVFSA